MRSPQLFALNRLLLFNDCLQLLLLLAVDSGFSAYIQLHGTDHEDVLLGSLNNVIVMH